MQFFTPDLYIRGQSDDGDEIQRVDDEWEAALAGYAARLEAIRDRTPPSVQELAGLCLHDAELLGYEEVLRPVAGGRWPGSAALSVRQEDGTPVTLTFALRGRIREHAPHPDWPVGAGRLDWLYEEVDLAGDSGTFVQRVLLSDGTVLEVPFTSVSVSRGPVSASERVRATV